MDLDILAWHVLLGEFTGLAQTAEGLACAHY